MLMKTALGVERYQGIISRKLVPVFTPTVNVQWQLTPGLTLTSHWSDSWLYSKTCDWDNFYQVSNQSAGIYIYTYSVTPVSWQINVGHVCVYYSVCNQEMPEICHGSLARSFIQNLIWNVCSCNHVIHNNIDLLRGTMFNVSENE